MRRPASRHLVALGLALVLVQPTGAWAHGGSELSTLSALPVALSVAVPAGLLVSGAAFTVIAVQGASDASVWVLERASDGARFSLHLSAGASAVVGGTVVVSAVAAGWVLSAAGEALCFIPNELGRALLHDERLTW
ncbi:hypothetical protein [Rubrivivax albus]|uniref:Uncharacterized protein n=1 Tax=Rubrivivax albus TaxID=2499835 RepID=A0A3S2TLE0_9BURK|nr:hypothetical protein [Rubrivivax albus]RVT50067.1 hypothetical protein ENE75_17270 [Rubrivivax albus]